MWFNKPPSPQLPQTVPPPSASLLRRLPRPGAGCVLGGRVLRCGGVLLNRMSLGRAWSSTELRELPKEEPLRWPHMLSSERVRYSDRRGDRFP